MNVLRLKALLCNITVAHINGENEIYIKFEQIGLISPDLATSTLVEAKYSK